MMLCVLRYFVEALLVLTVLVFLNIFQHQESTHVSIMSQDQREKVTGVIKCQKLAGLYAA